LFGGWLSLWPDSFRLRPVLLDRVVLISFHFLNSLHPVPGLKRPLPWRFDMRGWSLASVAAIDHQRFWLG